MFQIFGKNMNQCKNHFEYIIQTMFIQLYIHILNHIIKVKLETQYKMLDPPIEYMRKYEFWKHFQFIDKYVIKHIDKNSSNLM